MIFLNIITATIKINGATVDVMTQSHEVVATIPSETAMLFSGRKPALKSVILPFPQILNTSIFICLQNPLNEYFIFNFWHTKKAKI